jgi:hypothetical protein
MNKIYDKVEIIGLIEDEILALGTVPYQLAREAKRRAYSDRVCFNLMVEFMLHPEQQANVLRRLEAHLKRNSNV